MTNLVVICPATDPVERTLALWASLVLPPGTHLPGVSTLHDSGDPPETPESLQMWINFADVVLYFGHGTEDALGEPPWLHHGNAQVAADAAVVAFACFAGASLGPDSVAVGSFREFLGFDEPLFVYNAQPGLMGAELAPSLRAFLQGQISLPQARHQIDEQFRSIELLYRTGYKANAPDAMLIWMGARMNHRGLVCF